MNPKTTYAIHGGSSRTQLDPPQVRPYIATVRLTKEMKDKLDHFFFSEEIHGLNQVMPQLSVRLNEDGSGVFSINEEKYPMIGMKEDAERCHCLVLQAAPRHNLHLYEFQWLAGVSHKFIAQNQLNQHEKDRIKSRQEESQLLSKSRTSKMIPSSTSKSRKSVKGPRASPSNATMSTGECTSTTRPRIRTSLRSNEDLLTGAASRLPTLVSGGRITTKSSFPSNCSSREEIQKIRQHIYSPSVATEATRVSTFPTLSTTVPDSPSTLETDSMTPVLTTDDSMETKRKRNVLETEPQDLGAKKNPRIATLDSRSCESSTTSTIPSTIVRSSSTATAAKTGKTSFPSASTAPSSISVDQNHSTFQPKHTTKNVFEHDPNNMQQLHSTNVDSTSAFKRPKVRIPSIIDQSLGSFPLFVQQIWQKHVKKRTCDSN